MADLYEVERHGLGLLAPAEDLGKWRSSSYFFHRSAVSQRKTPLYSNGAYRLTASYEDRGKTEKANDSGATRGRGRSTDEEVLASTGPAYLDLPSRSMGKREFQPLPPVLRIAKPRRSLVYVSSVHLGRHVGGLFVTVLRSPSTDFAP